MIEAELDKHFGYEEYEQRDYPDYRNGIKLRKLRSSFCKLPIEISQDCDGDFAPRLWFSNAFNVPIRI